MHHPERWTFDWFYKRHDMDKEDNRFYRQTETERRAEQLHEGCQMPMEQARELARGEAKPAPNLALFAAFGAADAAKEQDLRGYYPMAARVLADEVRQLRAALQWYADGLHFDKASPGAWDTVSGEPPNWWCDEAGTATVEDGSIAAMVLRGELTGAQVQALD